MNKKLKYKAEYCLGNLWSTDPDILRPFIAYIIWKIKGSISKKISWNTLNYCNIRDMIVKNSYSNKHFFNKVNAPNLDMWLKFNRRDLEKSNKKLYQSLLNYIKFNRDWNHIKIYDKQLYINKVLVK